MLAKMRIFKKNPMLAQSGNAPTPVAESGSGMDLNLSRSLQLLLWALAIATLVWAFSDPRFRDAEGFLDTGVGVPVSAGVALLVMGWAVTRHLIMFAFWFALALIGQAVTLQLIEAGPSLRYQHYRPFDNLLTETQPWLLAFLAAQTLLVWVGLRKYYLKIWQWLRSTFKTWQLVAIGLVFVLSSAVVSPQIPVYIGEVGLASFLQVVQLGAILLMVFALPEEVRGWWNRFTEKLIGSLKPKDEVEPGRLDRFVLVVAFWVVALAALLSFFVYERHPHVPDEVAYLYHARFLAAGVLTAAAPPVPEAFETYLMQIDGGVWYPAPPVGWPLVLSLGVLVGAAWLVNPLLAGLNVLLAYLLLREIYSRRTARLAVLLLAVSPWYVFMGMNFMTHMFTLTCALLASLGVAWARRTDKAIWAWLGGLALGVIALVRPLEAVAVAAFLGLWAIGFGAKRLSFFAITGLVVGAMIAGSLTLLYNQIITSDPTEFPIMIYADQFFGPNSNALGFGPDRGMGWAIDPYPGHSPRDAVINANLNIASINVEMLGWSIGSLLVAGVMVFSGNLRRSDYLMLAVIAAVFTPHIFYYFSGGPDFGARYWFLMIIPAVALTARGVQFLEGKFPTSAGSFSNGSAWVTVAVVSLSVLTLVNYFPWRSLDKYHDFRGMSPDVRILAREHDFGRSLVLVRGDRHPDYASASIYNPLDLQADAPVYVWDRNPEVRAQVLEVYADRPVWILEGPSITQAGYQIVRGPLSAGELLAIPGEAP
jgi:hypothetical protein